jgi:hypothetical protein
MVVRAIWSKAYSGRRCNVRDAAPTLNEPCGAVHHSSLRPRKPSPLTTWCATEPARGRSLTANRSEKASSCSHYQSSGYCPHCKRIASTEIIQAEIENLMHISRPSRHRDSLRKELHTVPTSHPPAPATFQSQAHSTMSTLEGSNPGWEHNSQDGRCAVCCAAVWSLLDQVTRAHEPASVAYTLASARQGMMAVENQ